MRKRFSLGEVKATNSILREVRSTKLPLDELKTMLNKHQAGEWGDVPDGLGELNELSLKDRKGNIISTYIVKGIKYHVITERDRRQILPSTTTVLLHREYHPNIDLSEYDTVTISSTK